MCNHYLGILEDVDGKEHYVCMYKIEELIEFLKVIENSTFKLIGIQGIDNFLSLHNLKEILK